MFNRTFLNALLLSGLILPVVGCTSTEVDSISIAPATATVTAGQTVQLAATGSIGHGTHPATTEDVTSQVAWASSNPTVASVCTTGSLPRCTSATDGLVIANSVGTATITASMPGFGGIVSATATITVTAATTGSGGATVVSLSIVPAAQTVAAPTETGQYHAIGTTASGATVDVTSQVAWSSSSQQIATICTAGSAAPCTSATDGLAQAVSQGTATITAIYPTTGNNVVTGSSTFTVLTGPASGGTVVSVAIVPATQTVASPTETAQFFAIGTTNTGAATDLTNQVAWYSSSQQIATICTNGSAAPCTSSTNGLAEAQGQGTATITAIYPTSGNNVLTGSGTLTVTSGTAPGGGTVTSLTILPAAQTVASPNDTGQFIAIGTTSSGASVNLTNQVQWNSSSQQIASVCTPGSAAPCTSSTNGLAEAQGQGTATITAIYPTTGNNVVTGSGTFTVLSGTPGVQFTSLSVLPSAQTVATPNDTGQYFAIGTTSAGQTANLTSQVNWYSSSQQIASVCTQGSASPCSPATIGLAQAVSQGSSTITAIYPTSANTVVTGSGSFTVLSGTPTEQFKALTVYPATATAGSLGQQTQFFVLGTQGSTGLLFDVTSQAVWASSNTAVAIVCNAGMPLPACVGAPNGLVTAVGPGAATISATWTNTADGSKAVGSATYTASAGAPTEPLLSINVVPSVGSTVYEKGQTAQFLAFGNYSSPPIVRDVTNQVTWVTLLPGLASITSAAGVAGAQGGLATALGYTGDTVIYAEDTTTNPDRTVVYSNPTTFTCLDPVTQICDQGVPPVQVATLTVYNAGLNTTTWLVTAPSDTGVANLIHCGPGSTSGGSVCSGTYAAGSTVTLTASPTDSTFGGWSANCKVAIASPTCTITLNGNQSVGAIFN